MSIRCLPIGPRKGDTTSDLQEASLCLVIQYIEIPKLPVDCLGIWLRNELKKVDMLNPYALVFLENTKHTDREREVQYTVKLFGQLALFHGKLESGGSTFNTHPFLPVHGEAWRPEYVHTHTLYKQLCDILGTVTTQMMRLPRSNQAPRQDNWHNDHDIHIDIIYI